MVRLFGADEPARTEIVVVLDNEAHFEVVLGVGASWFYPLVGCRGLLLYLKQLLEMLATLTGLE